MSTNTQIPTLDGSDKLPAYVARPDGTPRGAIIVIQEVFGVEKGIRKKCDDWAAKGYLAVAPDVFWRQKPGVELDADVPEQFQQAIELMMNHDMDLGIQDVEAVIHWIRRDQGVPKVGLVGFCMGGKVAYMAAARTDVDASVGYYGVGIDQMLNESHAIANPLMLHVPTADGFVPPEAQKAMHEGLDGNPHVTIHDYEGLDHGFAAEVGARRDEQAAQLADKRTADFFAQNVG
ncbi:MAG: dienelactone hydrolase family protein [Novosphingobium sp.]|nr:dienelactone hydrolase family protein [Novosphingobium sp.]MCP5402036.1 dienelactone hydrolase family protein [Novosphingobium sp.]